MHIVNKIHLFVDQLVIKMFGKFKIYVSISKCLLFFLKKPKNPFENLQNQNLNCFFSNLNSVNPNPCDKEPVGPGV